MSKVKVSRETRGDRLMLCKLSPIITGDGLDRKRLQLRDDDPPDQLRRVPRDFSEAHELRLAINQTDDGCLVVAPDDGIGLPIAPPRFTVNELGAFRNGTARWELPAPRITAASVFGAVSAHVR